MRLFEKVERKKTYLRRALLAWYRRNARDLPWRRSGDPYRVWLSEILLQQTRVETALPYYKRLTEAFPTVRDLAAADEDGLLKLWEGLGYYNRARNLHKAARLIVNEDRGGFPQTAEEWQRLAGVGRSTANAIASIAFGEPVPVLDGNVKRVLARLFDIRRSIDGSGTLAELWSLAQMLVAPRAPGDFNQALMELGARVCIPKRPRCDKCPVRQECDARARSRQGRLPVHRQKQPLPHHELVAAAIEKNGRFLLGKRPAGGLLGGLWEFPSGRVARGESHHEALARVLRDELGVKIKIGALAASVNHAYSHFRITLHVYRCALAAGRPRARRYSEIKWIRRPEFARYAFCAAARSVSHLL